MSSRTDDQLLAEKPKEGSWARQDAWDAAHRRKYGAKPQPVDHDAVDQLAADKLAKDQAAFDAIIKGIEDADPHGSSLAYAMKCLARNGLRQSRAFRHMADQVGA